MEQEREDFTILSQSESDNKIDTEQVPRSLCLRNINFDLSILTTSPGVEELNELNLHELNWRSQSDCDFQFLSKLKNLKTLGLTLKCGSAGIGIKLSDLPNSLENIHLSNLRIDAPDDSSASTSGNEILLPCLQNVYLINCTIDVFVLNQLLQSCTHFRIRSLRKLAVKFLKNIMNSQTLTWIFLEDYEVQNAPKMKGFLQTIGISTRVSRTYFNRIMQKSNEGLWIARKPTACDFEFMDDGMDTTESPEMAEMSSSNWTPSLNILQQLPDHTLQKLNLSNIQIEFNIFVEALSLAPCTALEILELYKVKFDGRFTVPCIKLPSLKTYEVDLTTRSVSLQNLVGILFFIETFELNPSVIELINFGVDITINSCTSASLFLVECTDEYIVLDEDRSFWGTDFDDDIHSANLRITDSFHGCGIRDNLLKTLTRLSLENIQNTTFTFGFLGRWLEKCTHLRLLEIIDVQIDTSSCTDPESTTKVKLLFLKIFVLDFKTTATDDTGYIQFLEKEEFAKSIFFYNESTPQDIETICTSDIDMKLTVDGHKIFQLEHQPTSTLLSQLKFTNEILAKFPINFFPSDLLLKNLEVEAKNIPKNLNYTYLDNVSIIGEMEEEFLAQQTVQNLIKVTGVKSSLSNLKTFKLGCYDNYKSVNEIPNGTKNVNICCFCRGERSGDVIGVLRHPDVESVEISCLDVLIENSTDYELMDLFEAEGICTELTPDSKNLKNRSVGRMNIIKHNGLWRVESPVTDYPEESRDPFCKILSS